MRRIFFLSVLCMISVGGLYAQDTNGQEKTPKSELIEAFLPERTYKTLTESHDISQFAVKHILLDSDTLEYSNKLVFLRDLTQEEVTSLLQLLNDDASYIWKEYNDDFTFYPCRQYVLKNGRNPINVIVNFEYTHVSFISLEGQMVIPIQLQLRELLLAIN